MFARLSRWLAKARLWFYKHYPHHCRTTFEQFCYKPASTWTCEFCGEPIEWPRYAGEAE